MQQKGVYQTRAEAQEVVDKRVSEMGRPLWIYPVRDGFSITSKGYNQLNEPDGIMSLNSFSAEHPQHYLVEDSLSNDITIYRLMARSQGLSQFYRRPIPMRSLAMLLEQPGTVFVITLPTLDKGVSLLLARQLCKTLRQYTEHYVRYAWAYNQTLVMKGGMDWRELEREMRDVRLMYAAISGPNNDAEERLNGQR